jgi:hypothetical protein
VGVARRHDRVAVTGEDQRGRGDPAEPRPAGAEALTWIAATLLAPTQDIPTGEWRSLAAVGHALADYAMAPFWVGGDALLGLTVAVLTRSVPVALAIGIACRRRDNLRPTRRHRVTTTQPGTGSMTAATLPRRDQLILALGLAVLSLIAGLTGGR